MPGVCLQGGRANGEGTHTLLYDENLLVGMLMQPDVAFRWHIYPYKRNLSILMLGSDELIGIPIVRQIIPFENRVIHAKVRSFSVVLRDRGSSAYASLIKASFEDLLYFCFMAGLRFEFCEYTEKDDSNFRIYVL